MPVAVDSVRMTDDSRRLADAYCNWRAQRPRRPSSPAVAGRAPTTRRSATKRRRTRPRRTRPRTPPTKAS